MQDPSLYEHTLQTAVKAQTQQPEVQLPFSEQQEQQLPCPRCHSTNTKFCYYNNYNLTQPRHFCRACRRHWTKGGTLRNIPVGGGGSGGPRKNSKRSSTSTAAVGAKQVPSSSKNRNVCDLEGQNGNFVSSAAMEGQFGGFVESSSGSNSGVNGQYADPCSGRDAGQIPGPGSSHHWW